MNLNLQFGSIFSSLLVVAVALPAQAGIIVPPPPPDPVHTLVAQLNGDFADLPIQSDPRFGYSVALHGDTLVVGAPGTLSADAGPGGVDERGAVFVYRRHPVNDSWQLEQRLVPSVGGAAQCGHAVAVSEFSLLIGCPFATAGGIVRGGALFYTRNTVNAPFSSPASFFDASIQANAQCGSSVALIGSAAGTDSPLPMAAVGCPNRRNFPQGDFGFEGAVDIYASLFIWSQVHTLTPGAANSDFGRSLSLYRGGPNPGRTLLLAVGRPGTTSGASGQVQVYAMGATVGSWSVEQQYTGPAAGSRFGYSVHLEHGRLVIGAPQRPVTNAGLNPPAPVPSGSVSLAIRSCTIQGQCGWSQPQNVVEFLSFPIPIASTAAQNRFGHAVHALAPLRIIGGEPHNPFTTFNGRAQHLVFDDGSWNLVDTEPFYPSPGLPATSEFGAAIAGDPGWLAIGAPGYPQENNGRVFVYAYDYDDTIFANGFQCGIGSPGCR